MNSPQAQRAVAPRCALESFESHQTPAVDRAYKQAERRHLPGPLGLRNRAGMGLSIVALCITTIALSAVPAQAAFKRPLTATLTTAGPALNIPLGVAVDNDPARS